uniref:non-specific serine/threonine protein kinase n=1 Tax=Sedum alfredii TaxID=439688 RepID=A0A410N657_9MAGN|nr:LRR receptor-like serine/threonine-protein kinase EFR [Sedum alfredii]
MGQTNLTGKIPSTIGNLSVLRDFSVYFTNLHGSIPNEMGKLKTITRLDLTLNSLSGKVPSVLYNLSNIREISFTGNGLIGRLPPTLGDDFPLLRLGYFGLNDFTGGVPPTLSNTSGLLAIDFVGNKLEGTVPEGISRLQNLFYLGLGTNNLGSGEDNDLDFIGSLANLSSLRILSIESNNFGGLIPASIGNLSNKLEQLDLGSNKIYGNIPMELGNLVNLINLGIKNNKLSGDLPTSLGNLQMLGELDLSNNRLDGSIPLFFGNLSILNTLILNDNQLKGQIPSTLRYCSRLQSLSLHNNRLSGSIPGEILGGLYDLLTLKLYGNSFSGRFPKEVGNLDKLSMLDISKNKFSGELPNELGKCVMIEILKMGENNFSGNIPLSFSSLRTARVIDLSCNILTGNIPLELQALSNLQVLNLSFNQLEGEVPFKGPFANLSAIYLLDNKRLCGGLSQLGLPRCFKRQGRQLISTKAAIGIAVSLFVCLLFAVLLVYLLRRKGSNTTVLSIPSMKSGSFQRLTYKELSKATNEFSTRNLIGVGGFGLVYKGVLEEDKNLIAVKVMTLATPGAAKSFIAECKVLSRVRHRNLLQILSYCSGLDFKGNEFMALVFELMPNGNLDTWLHVSKNLKLTQRLEIAIDVASALDYLHHDSEPQVVHCDLKPSNVLLDSDMVAHVGDFGLAKLVQGTVADDTSKGQSSTFAVRGTVGYVPPEYGMGGNVSTQGDVYSYGILLLEMITGKRPTDVMFKDDINLHTLCSYAVSKSSPMEILDLHLVDQTDVKFNRKEIESIGEQILQESAVGMLEIGIACSAENPNERIDIRHALNALHKIKAKLFQFN